MGASYSLCQGERSQCSSTPTSQILLRLFNANSVRYLVIGGYAVVQYAEPRFTKDLDLWISTDASNAAAEYEALREFGAPLSGLTESDFAEEGYFYQMGCSAGTGGYSDGSSRFAVWRSLVEKCVEVDFDGLPVSFISRQDLIASKLASGRPQDLLDADLLSQSDEN